MTHALANIKHVLLDMDGTMFLDERVFPETIPFLETLRQLGIGRTFITNNCSQRTSEYVAKLRRMEIDVEASDIHTSADATIEFLRSNLPATERLFVLGTPSLCGELTDARLRIVEMDEEPDAVVIGFDTGLTFDRLCRGAYWIQRGKLFVATNPDFTCPTDEPTVLVDCGSICAALSKATGRKPDHVFGKPRPEMIEGLLQRLGLAPTQVAMVGDRLYTDMRMAKDTGLLGVLVLTGETTRQAAEHDRSMFDSLVPDLGELARQLRAARCSPSSPEDVS